MKAVKQWQCKGEHVLGMVVKDGAGVPQLMLLRHAVDAAALQPEPVDVMLGPVVGMMRVKCDICEDVVTWHASVDAMLYLVDKMPTDLLFQFWYKLAELAKRGGHVKE